MRAKIEPKSKVKRPRLRNLSVYPLTPEQAIAALLKVDPKKVDAKMKEQGIVLERKTKKTKKK